MTLHACTFLGNIIRISLFYCLLIPCFNLNAASSWHPINDNIQFIKQPDKLRFYDSNQVLIEGDKCALLYDAGGNFAQVEHLAKALKARLNTPLCYLVASNGDNEHLLGMAVLQHAFPDAKLIVHENLALLFEQYQNAYNDKLEGFKKSIELSLHRITNLEKDQQLHWEKKLALAKTRLIRWQDYQLQVPQITIAKTTTINLGQFNVVISPHSAYSKGDLTLSTNNGSILIGSDIVNWLPYLSQGNLKQWEKLLLTYGQQPQLTTIIPGHGNLLTPSQLQQPRLFLSEIIAHTAKNPNSSIEQLKLSFPADIMKPYQADILDKKNSALFLQTGLLRALKTK
ncbi:MBL fold metallo-hydrolase [Pseudoalteromonas sp. MMG010]|uniref:MBL fold metallo-hydrolase n=1 Tax=Pseudoalteromonas sp. MMG010 TaxID=2822685 RepID=UPI001B3A7B7F|nr:MBL fold metallo-hydrolase [Pseudoalteromonas sp. MMG010]MBQ4832741.1 MBL fold metallo-hydrolase [Pseudoalteromonas sp. MMG010]